MARSDRLTNLEKKKDIYSDFLVNFNAHPNTGELMRKTDLESVKRAIRNILLTDRGERLFNEKYGASVRKVLFEQADDFSKDMLKNLIQQSIENYEKRVKLVEVVVGMGNDEITYIVDIYFKMINNQNVFNLQVKLDRVR